MTSRRPHISDPKARSVAQRRAKLAYRADLRQARFEQAEDAKVQAPDGKEWL